MRETVFDKSLPASDMSMRQICYVSRQTVLQYRYQCTVDMLIVKAKQLTLYAVQNAIYLNVLITKQIYLIVDKFCNQFQIGDMNNEVNTSFGIFVRVDYGLL